MTSIDYPLLVLGYRGDRRPKPILYTAIDVIEELERLHSRVLANEETQRRGKKVRKGYQYPPNPERAALHADLARDIKYTINYLRCDCDIAEQE